nr:GntR family transcriptional regulator [uncultured Lichenicoccus sp.]
MPTKPSHATESLTTKVYNALRRDILACAIIPGQELSEGVLAARFKMSKTPVREALGKLRSEGLIKTYPRRGYQVASVTFRDLNELFEMRSLLEGRAAELANEKITPEKLDHLESLAHVVYDRAEKPSIMRFVQANRRFHEAIALASGNQRLHATVVQVLDELERFFHLGAQLRDVGLETSASHRKIVQALRKGDAVLARRNVIEEIEATQHGLILALTKQSSSLMELKPAFVA